MEIRRNRIEIPVRSFASAHTNKQPKDNNANTQVDCIQGILHSLRVHLAESYIHSSSFSLCSGVKSAQCNHQKFKFLFGGKRNFQICCSEFSKTFRSSLFSFSLLPSSPFLSPYGKRAQFPFPYPPPMNLNSIEQNARVAILQISQTKREHNIKKIMQTNGST